jgi:hypothetical protein
VAQLYHRALGHTEHTYIVRTSQETHYVSARETNQLVLFEEIVAVYCEKHTEHTDALCGQNIELFKCQSIG